MAKSKPKREEKAAQQGEDYVFEIPKFDEQAFIRREVLSARSTFWALGLGIVGGALSIALFVAGIDWRAGWLPIFAAMAVMKPLLQKRNYPEELLAIRALIGPYFTIFFTGLAVWILGVNFL